MIEKFINKLQSKLNLDKDGQIFPDDKYKSSAKDKEPVFKSGNFVLISEEHCSKPRSQPIYSFDIDDPKDSILLKRIARSSKYSIINDSKEIIFEKNTYLISNRLNTIFENIDLLDEKGYLAIVCNENELSEKKNKLINKFLSNKGCSINAEISLTLFKSRFFNPRSSIYIISKFQKEIFIANILEDGSNAEEVLDNLVNNKKTPLKKQKDIDFGYFIERSDFISLYYERAKSRIEKITAFDEGFKTCKLEELLLARSSGNTSREMLEKTDGWVNSLYVLNKDSNSDSYDERFTEDDWVTSIAHMGPIKYEQDHDRYFYIAVNDKEVRAEYLVIFLRSYLGRELYRLTPKSKTVVTGVLGDVLKARMTYEDLGQMQIYYPDLKTQNEIIEANLQLNKLQDSVNLFNESLLANPNKLIGESSDQIQELLGVVGKLNSADRIRNHIRKIETGYSEFKETWRLPVDFEGNKIKKDFEKRAENMTPDIFKVINSFLNSYGGDLMIGINDRSHEPRGIEKEIDHYWGYKESEHFACLEKFENEFKKTLYSCFDKKYIGEEKNIFWEFVPYEGCTVFLIRCRQSSSRCYLKHDSDIRKKLGHSFYQRLGNDSEPIDSDEDRDKFWSDRSAKDNQI